MLRIVILAALAVLSLSLPAGAAEPSDYAGRFEADSAIDHGAAVEAAVDDVVEGMNPLIRGIARKRLLKAATWSTTFTFEPDGASMTIRSDRLPEGRTTPLDGSETEGVSDRGEAFFLSRWMEDGRLCSNGRSDRGSHGNVFELSADGQRLVVTTTIRNDNLPKPLVYRVQYSRTR